MRTVNRVTLLGNVGQEPRITATAGGNTVATLSLATHSRTKDKRDVTVWHRLVAFGRTAEIVRDYVVKGAPLYIEGELQVREWEQGGQKRSTTEVLIHDLSLPGNKAANASKSVALNGSTSDMESTDYADCECLPERKLKDTSVEEGTGAHLGHVNSKEPFHAPA